MNIRKFFIYVVGAIMMVACSGKGDVAPLIFESYENTAQGASPEGGSAGLELKIDIPVGKGECQDKVTAGIREIIIQSEVGKELKQPVEGSLKEIADVLLGYFPVGVAKGEVESSGLTYHLWIENESQNSKAVFFHVGDGIFGNGGPSESYKIVRLYDGKLMDDKDVYNASGNDIVTLVKKYGTNEQKEADEAFIGAEAYLCPVGDSCRVLYLEGAHFWNVITVPINEVEGFLTEEGKKLFMFSDATTPITSQEEAVEAEPDAAKPAEPGRGELGIFDLRGAVKSCKWKTESGTKTYTFDENGFWLTEDGKNLKQLYAGGIERDKSGRITVGAPDEFYNITYTYNDRGLVTKTFCDGITNTYTYDEDGYVAKEHVDIAPEMGDDEGVSAKQYTLIYTILEKDEIGNWTKRKSKQGTETRTLEYFQQK